MEALFCRLLLQHIDHALQEEPCGDSLLKLLQIADPAFSDDDLLDAAKRSGSLRALTLLIHPDKHNGDYTATKRFQDTRIFYDRCVDCLSNKKRKRRVSVLAPSALPNQFHVTDRWPFLSSPPHKPVPPPDELLSVELMERLLAYKCINYRGAIAHGKRTELAYSCPKGSIQSVAEVFTSFGGAKTLESVAEIKEEIQKNGPVVSNSFLLARPFLSAGNHSFVFQASLVNKTHAVLLVGWKQTAFGEVWLVRSLKGAGIDIPVAIGQYSIEDEVVAPVSDLSDRPWQRHDKAFDMVNLPSDWYTVERMDSYHSTEELSPLFRILGCSLKRILSSKVPFVVRDASKICRSRYAYLTEMEWVEFNKKWKLTFEFCDQKWTI